MLLTPVAAQTPERGAAPAAQVVTVMGELVEVMCHGRLGDEARGAAHAECALKCATAGNDLAILTEDGLYVVTGRAAGGEDLFGFIGVEVAAAGVVTEGEDGRSIEVAYGLPEPEDGYEIPPGTVLTPYLMMGRMTAGGVPDPPIIPAPPVGQAEPEAEPVPTGPPPYVVEAIRGGTRDNERVR